MNKFDAMMAYLKTYHRQHGQAGAPGPPPSPLSAPMPPPPPPLGPPVSVWDVAMPPCGMRSEGSTGASGSPGEGLCITHKGMVRCSLVLHLAFCAGLPNLRSCTAFPWAPQECLEEQSLLSQSGSITVSSALLT